MSILETRGLGRRYGGRWALRDCDLTIPEGHLVALVGPNGAGKSTLLNLVVGLTTPSTGDVTVLDGEAAGSPAALDEIAFVAQSMPLYRHLSVRDMLHLTRNLNRTFDGAFARRRLADLGIDPRQKVGRLSGGQHAQLALTLALARRPRLLVLDEPTASLDPLARHDFLAAVMTAMADDGVSVLLSSHILTELERVADYLVLILAGRVRLDGPVEEHLARHLLVVGPADAPSCTRVGGGRVAHHRGADPTAGAGPGRFRSRARGVGGAAGRRRGAGPGLPPGWRSRFARAGGGRAMTALAAPAALRPVAWQRLAWVVWRRYRTTLIAVLALLSVLGSYLAVTGHRMRTAYSSLEACTPAHSAACQFRWNDFHNTYGGGGLISVVLVLLPGLVGAFAGAPLLARELESGTFRYAWTQGVGRMRWAVATVVPGLVGLAVVMALMGALVSWHNTPLVDAGITPRFEGSVFPVTGLAIVGWAVLGFALALLAGLLWRRVVPALATAFAVWFGLAYVASRVRLHYEAPLTTTSLRLGRTASCPSTSGGTRTGSASTTPRSTRCCRRSASSSTAAATSPHAPGAGAVDPVQYLVQHGYTQVTSYQPDSRYWPFQWIELGWLAVLSIALVAVTFWLLRRRAA